MLSPMTSYTTLLLFGARSAGLYVDFDRLSSQVPERTSVLTASGVDGDSAGFSEASGPQPSRARKATRIVAGKKLCFMTVLRESARLIVRGRSCQLQARSGSGVARNLNEGD